MFRRFLFNGDDGTPQGGGDLEGMAQNMFNEFQQQNQDVGDKSDDVKDIEGIPVDKFQAAIRKFTGNEELTLDGFKQSWGKVSEFDSLSKKAAELELKTKQNPFADERVAKLNTLMASGASNAEINHWWKLQQLDIESISDKDAIREHYRLTKPHLSDEEIATLMEADYGSDEERSAHQKVLFKEAAVSAKKALSEQKVVSGETEAVRKQKAQQQQYNTRLNIWGKYAPQVFSSNEYEHSIAMGKDPNTGEEKTLSVKIEVSDEQKKAIIAQTVKWAAQSGIDPTAENLTKQIIPYYNSMVKIANMDALLKKVALETQAKSNRSWVGRRANVPPRTPNGFPQNPPQQNQTEDMQAQIRKMKFGFMNRR